MIYYSWHVEKKPHKLSFTSQDTELHARNYFVSRFLVGLLITFCLFMIGISIFFFSFKSNMQTSQWALILFVLISLGTVFYSVNYLRKTPFMPLSYEFNTGQKTLIAKGKTWLGKDETQTLKLRNIEQIVATFSVGKGSKYYFIRINMINPEQYFIISPSISNLEEVRNYIGFLQTILPEKTRDELM
jgi:hypothetical protein